jgi:hypothetical protein
MPNSCDNRLAIRGNAQRVMALVKLLDGETPFDFERVLPLPPPSPERSSNKEAIEAWGTKWTAWLVTRQGYGATGRVRYCFRTAYGPPSGVLNEIARRFPEIEMDLSYEVELLAGGAAQWRNGHLTKTEGEAKHWPAPR